jgi:hypothetical protein
MTQQPKQVVLPSPRKKQLGTKQSKRGIQLPR